MCSCFQNSVLGGVLLVLLVLEIESISLRDGPHLSSGALHTDQTKGSSTWMKRHRIIFPSTRRSSRIYEKEKFRDNIRLIKRDNINKQFNRQLRQQSMQGKHMRRISPHRRHSSAIPEKESFKSAVHRQLLEEKNRHPKANVLLILNNNSHKRGQPNSKYIKQKHTDGDPLIVIDVAEITKRIQSSNLPSLPIHENDRNYANKGKLLTEVPYYSHYPFKSKSEYKSQEIKRSDTKAHSPLVKGYYGVPPKHLEKNKPPEAVMKTMFRNNHKSFNSAKQKMSTNHVSMQKPTVNVHAENQNHSFENRSRETSSRSYANIGSPAKQHEIVTDPFIDSIEIFKNGKYRYDKNSYQDSYSSEKYSERENLQSIERKFIDKQSNNIESSPIVILRPIRVDSPIFLGEENQNIYENNIQKQLGTDTEHTKRHSSNELTHSPEYIRKYQDSSKRKDKNQENISSEINYMKQNKKRMIGNGLSSLKLNKISPYKTMRRNHHVEQSRRSNKLKRKHRHPRPSMLSNVGKQNFMRNYHSPTRMSYSSRPTIDRSYPSYVDSYRSSSDFTEAAREIVTSEDFGSLDIWSGESSINGPTFYNGGLGATDGATKEQAYRTLARRQLFNRQGRLIQYN